MEVKMVQSDMNEENLDLVNRFIIKAFKEKFEYEDIAKYIKDNCDNSFGGEYLCLVVERYAGFGSCLKYAPGSLFIGDYQDYRIIIFGSSINNKEVNTQNNNRNKRYYSKK